MSATAIETIRSVEFAGTVEVEGVPTQVSVILNDVPANYDSLELQEIPGLENALTDAALAAVDPSVVANAGANGVDITFGSVHATSEY